jgi:Protein of unknown function (DUF3179)
MKRMILITGLLLLFAAEILRVYFVMPFPGSQYRNTIALAYGINNNIIWIRLLALALIIFPLRNIFKTGQLWMKIVLSSILVLYVVVFFFLNYRFEADKMFSQAKQKVFAVATADTTDKNELVIGVAINGEAKAYPIRIIGYHHQVMDTVGNTPLMITYCTVCRTGRVYSPFVNGKKVSFRLVGMDHFNAMFEDAATGSWWQQATGKVIAGPLKGTALTELTSKQLTLAAWLREYPYSQVLQPDPSFKKDYNDLAGYDKGTIKGGLEKRDSASWKRKSWVVGVTLNNTSKAYDWNQLVRTKVINDLIEGLPVVLALENDTASFHMYDRLVDGVILNFQKGSDDVFFDDNTRSTWSMDGVCIAGTMKGERLKPLQSYQEFWHSWSTFHPNTTKYQDNTNQAVSAGNQDKKAKRDLVTVLF